MLGCKRTRAARKAFLTEGFTWNLEDESILTGKRESVEVFFTGDEVYI